MTPIEFIDNLPFHRRTSLRQMAEELNKEGITTKRGCLWTAAAVFAEYRRNQQEYSSTPKACGSRISKAMRNLSRAQHLIRSSIQILNETNG